MTDEHWFDVFSKAAVHATTRRGVVRSAAVLVPSLLLSSEAGIAADKKKRRKKKDAGGKGGKKGGKKDKGKSGAGNQGSPDQGNGAAPAEQMGPPEPAVDYCADMSLEHEDPLPPEPERVELAREWVNDCHEIEAQCQEPDTFCIYISDWDHATQRRDVACCPSPKKCCKDGCFDTQNDRDHCGASCDRCAAGELCIAGHCVCGDPRGCDVCERNCCPVGEKFCDNIGCIPEGNECCGYGDHDGCSPRMPCCGSGDDRYCSAYLDICS